MSYFGKSNFAYGTVLTPPSPAASGTSLMLNSGQGALFGSTLPYPAIVWPAGPYAGTLATAEIVLVTGRVGDVFTITRTQEGTAARTILAGDQFAQVPTAAVWQEIQDAIDNIPGGGDVVGPGSSVSGNFPAFDGTTGALLEDSGFGPADFDAAGAAAAAQAAAVQRGNHTGSQAISTVTGLQSALDGKVDENGAITGATKTKVTYDAKGLVTAGADATTADIADSSNKRYVTDAQLVVIGNTSGTNTGDQSSVTGNAGTATALATPRAINGVNFDGTAPITVAAAAGTLTGATLAAGVTASSLTSAAGGAFGTAAFTAASAYDAAGAAAAAQAASQPLDSDLTALAAISPSNGDIIARVSGAWVKVTPSTVAFVVESGILKLLTLVQAAASDVTTQNTAGAGKVSFRVNFGGGSGTLLSVRACVKTAPTGSGEIYDINKNGTTVLSTKLTIDAGETTSLDATPPVISVSSWADDDIFSVDVDQAGSTTGALELVVSAIFKVTPP